LPATSEFQQVCQRAGKLLAACEGYFLDRLNYTIAGVDDAVQITLIDSPEKPSVIVELTRTYHLVEAQGSFFDELTVTHVPAFATEWPPGFPMGPRHRGLPDLVRVRLVGPATIDVVAQTLNVLVSQTDRWSADGASALPEA
jgi:hypothetical protein